MTTTTRRGTHATEPSRTTKAPLHDTTHISVGEDGRLRPKLRAGAWRTEVRDRAEKIRVETRQLAVSKHLRSHATDEFVTIEIYDRLRRAEALARAKVTSPSAWLTGAVVEEAWKELRAAEAGLHGVVADDHLRAFAVDAQSHAERYLSPSDPRRVELSALLAKRHLSPVDLAHMRDTSLLTLGAAHEVSDVQNRQQRDVRNTGLALASVLLVGAALLVGLQALGNFTLVSPPKGVTRTEAMLLVMLFGFMGALFSALPSLAAMTATTARFNVRRQQAWLKVTTGIWSAIGGVLVVQAGWAAGDAKASSITTLALTAMMLGSAQEALTRFFDTKARKVLESS